MSRCIRPPEAISQLKSSVPVVLAVRPGRRRLMVRNGFTIRILLYAMGLSVISTLAHGAMLRAFEAGSWLAATVAGGLVFAVPACWLVRHAVGSTSKDNANARSEAAALSSALETSARLTTIGQIATGIVHELNNPLTYVRANLGQLREDWGALQKGFGADGASDDLAAEVEELIDESLEGVERVIALVRDVTGIAHAGFDHAEDFELNTLLDGVIRVASAQQGPRVRVERTQGEPVWATGLPQEIKQVFLNLIVNAIQAVGEHGSVCVSTSETDRGATVSIQDDGVGIESDSIEKLFDPFYTTKPVGQGTGLGLSISREIIERHQGEISMRSELEQGTCVTVFLPART